MTKTERRAMRNAAARETGLFIRIPGIEMFDDEKIVAQWPGIYNGGKRPPAFTQSAKAPKDSS
jgi:hypothetical protein